MGQVVFPFTQPLDRPRGKVLGRVASPRVSPAAMRVPDPRHAEVPIVFPAGHPQIFVHEGARQLLERRLTQAFRRPVLLSVTDNRRHMIASTDGQGVVRVRLHHMFLDAPPRVHEALVRFVVDKDRDASVIVGRYIEDNGFRIRASRPVPRLTTAGATHDLLALYRQVNERYFGGAVDALITWGRRTHRGGPRRAIKLGSYSAVERLIRIHPALDRPWVPRYFLGYIVYHEMLHHLIPAGHGGGRRRLHPPLFQARERGYRHYERAVAWERAHLTRLLRG